MPYPVQGAALAPITTGVLSTGQVRRILVMFTAIALAIALIAIEAPSATDARSYSNRPPAQRIVAIARSHIGARFRIGTEGMRYFDCSGLVYRVYAQAHLLKKIGGSRKLAAGYYHWFRARGLVGRRNARVGDLVWWTHKGRISHMGLYIGNGRAISALINPWGVKSHHLNTIHARFLAFGHVRLAN